MAARPHVVARISGRSCAIDCARVSEVLRPLRVDPVPDPDPAVLGVAVLRGAPALVVDGAALIGAARGPGGRWLALRGRDRTVALAVDEVLGVRLVDPASPTWAFAQGRVQSIARWGDDVLLVLRDVVEAGP